MKINPTPKRIKLARIASKLTQEQAGQLIGYSRRAWQAWESGDRKMRASTLAAFLMMTGKKTDGLPRIRSIKK